jgi:hypothetical protein
VQGGKLATAQARVEGDGPQCAVVGALEVRAHRLDLRGGGEPVLAQVDGGDAEPGCRVVLHLAELPGAAVDRAQRRDRRGDGGGGVALGGEPVDEALQLRQGDLAQAFVA